MSKREIVAYAITHAPPSVKGKAIKGGPYEGYGEYGTPSRSARGAMRWGGPRAAEAYAVAVRKVHPHARVIRIVRARPSEASATLETARRRLASVAESMTEHAYQEMASALEVDACRVGPSEASAVEVLRELVAKADARNVGPGVDWETIARARAVLAAAGPDPMPVVRAAMRRRDERKAYLGKAGAGRGGTTRLWEAAENDEDAAVDAYRKAGGTP